MSGFSTPKKGNTEAGGSQSPLTPKTRQRVDYDPWNIDHHLELKGPAKKLKLDDDHVAAESVVTDEEFKIVNLAVGLCLDRTLDFCVSFIDVFKTDNGQTLKIGACDDSGETSIAMFNWDERSYLDFVKVGEGASMTNFRVKADEKNVNKAIKNKLGITRTTSTLLQPAKLKTGLKFNFQTIEDLSLFVTDELVDVVAVVESNWKMTGSGTSRRRVLTLVDETGFCAFTLWNWKAENFGDSAGQVVAIRNALVGSFNGKKTIQTKFYTGIVQDYSDQERTAKLKEWYIQKVKEREDAIAAREQDQGQTSGAE